MIEKEIILKRLMLSLPLGGLIVSGLNLVTSLIIGLLHYRPFDG